MLRLMLGSSLWVEIILTDFVGMKKFLVSFSGSSTTFPLTFSPVLDFNSINISLWDSACRFLISVVISSFKEPLKPSRRLISTLGDFALEGSAMLASWSRWQTFSTTIGETKPSLTLSVLSCWISFLLLFWFLVVNICGSKGLLWVFPIILYCIVLYFSTKLKRGLKKKNSIQLYRLVNKTLSPEIIEMPHIYTLLASFDYE